MILALLNRDRLTNLKFQEKDFSPICIAGMWWVATHKRIHSINEAAGLPLFEYKFRYINRKGRWSFSDMVSYSDERFTNFMERFMKEHGYDPKSEG